MYKKIAIKNIVIYITVLIIVFMFMVPVLWIIAGSLKKPAILFSYPPVFWFKPQFENFIHAFSPGVNIQKYLLNSAFYAILSTVLSLIIGLPAGYALSRSKNAFGKIFGYWALLLRAVPPISLIVPLYSIFVQIGLIGRWECLVISYTGFNIPFVIWIMSGFFADVREDIVDAAQIDGCSAFGVLTRVAVPLVLPGIMVVGIFSVIFSWNDFLYALLLTTKDTSTVAVRIGSYWADVSIQWGMLLSSSVLAMLPLLGMAFVLQKYIVRGLTFGAVKE